MNRFQSSRPALLLLVLLSAGCAVRREEQGTAASAPESAVAEAEPGAAMPEPTPAQSVAPEGPAPYRGDLKPFIASAAASSAESGCTPDRAFDGQPSTRWSNAFKDGEWIEGSFDRPVRIERLNIRWENARAIDFSVRLFNTRSNWVEVGRRTDAIALEDEIAFPRPLSALALRIECSRRSTDWGNSIWEVDMFGTTQGNPPSNRLIAVQGPVTPWQLREREVARQLLAQAAADPETSAELDDAEFLDLVARRAFDYFWYETNPTNGLTKDRARSFMSSEECSIASVAAVGFALTAYAIGAEEKWVPRDEALDRTRHTLRAFASGPIRHLNGFFPHFVDLFTAADSPGTEISTIDTTLFLAGMIVAAEYFQDPEVSELSRLIFERVDWNWARNGNPNVVSMGVDAGGNFLSAGWGSMNEGILLYLLAMGSPTHPLPVNCWYAIDRHTGDYAGYTFVIEYGFQSIFRFQYPALFYDFRGRTDKAGMDYFENATLAVLAMREYCIRQAENFPDSYGPDRWGLGAADGLGDRYMIYGFPPGDPYSPTDGTFIPYAIAGSVPFLPQHAIRALRKLYDENRKAWGKYGFADAVNPGQDFVARDAIGIDEGAVLLGIDAYRSQFVWKLFMRNEWIRKSTAAIGWKTRPRSTDRGGPVDLARDASWRLITGGGDQSSPDLDDQSWKKVVVPEFWENAAPELAHYDGSGWYRATFTLDADRLAAWNLSGRPIVLTLGAVDDEDAAYVNGFKVGGTASGPDVFRKTRRYRLPGTYLRAGRNVVAIQITDHRGTGGIWRTPLEIGPE